MTTPYYRDDAVTLYCGDFRDVPLWAAADVLITDPPYGIRWTRRYGHPNRRLPAERDAIHADNSTAARDDALAMWGDTNPAMVFGTWKQPRPTNTRAVLIWHKAGSYSGPTNAAFMANHEEIHVIGGGWVRTAPPLRSVITTTEPRHHAARRGRHPTPKPVPLMAALIGRTQPGWVVADPFAGTGATLIAAKAMGRHAIGVEIDEAYCQTTADRLTETGLFTLVSQPADNAATGYQLPLFTPDTEP